MRPRTTTTTIIVVVLAMAVALVACSSSSTTSTPTTHSAGNAGSSTATTLPGPPIKLGVVMVNYDCIKSYIDFNDGDERKAWQTLGDDINAHGGVNGRKLQLVFDSYCPIGNAEALRACTSLTEDQKVFAVLGVFIDFSGDAQLCIAKNHKIVHIGHELSEAWIDKAPPGLLLSANVTAERLIRITFALLERTGALQGHVVAVMGETRSQSRLTDVIEPALKKMGVKQGSEASLNITGTDFTAPLAQLDSFIERWKGQHVDTVIVSGLTAISKPFITKLKKGLPNVTIITDAPSSGLGAAQDDVAAHLNPNPYDGMISAQGLSDQERFQRPDLQQCVHTYEQATGTTVLSPDAVKPGADGKRALVFAGISNACTDLGLFKELATRAGATLDDASWTKAVNSIGRLAVVGTPYASLHTGKYDADDGFRLVKFDPTIGNKGDWAPMSQLSDLGDVP
jgi:hypothetical protein